MAIAAFERAEGGLAGGSRGPDGAGRRQSPGRPELRLVGTAPDGDEAATLAEITSIDARRSAAGALPLRHGAEVSQRRAARRRVVVRHRRVALAVLSVGLLAGLALPVGLLGGHAPDAAATALPNAADAGNGVIYVVQPGDTLASIASRVDPGHAGRLAHLLARETGSATVVPGEHLRLP
jgi:hypothetical protein